MPAAQVVQLESSLAEKLREIFTQPWLETPNARLGGKTPQELLDLHDNEPLRDLLEQAKQGVMS